MMTYSELVKILFNTLDDYQNYVLKCMSDKFG